VRFARSCRPFRRYALRRLFCCITEQPLKCGGLVGKYCYGSAAVTSHVLKNVVDQLGPSHDGQFQASVSRSRQFHANLESLEGTQRRCDCRRVAEHKPNISCLGFAGDRRHRAEQIPQSSGPRKRKTKDAALFSYIEPKRIQTHACCLSRSQCRKLDSIGDREPNDRPKTLVWPFLGRIARSH